MLVAGALIFFPILMAFAASSDLLTMTISNWISIILVLGFVALAEAARLPLPDLLSNLSCGVAILALTFSLFCFGWVGGGDAKLAAATAVWLGWGHILDYGLIASLLGGLLTLSLISMRKSTLPGWIQAPWVARLLDKKSGIPYGIALSAAGLMVYPTTQLWIAIGGS